MTEFEKLIMEELRSLRSEVKDDINIIHVKIDKVESRVGKLDAGLNLFKGKAFGFMALLSILFNTGLHYLGKK